MLKRIGVILLVAIGGASCLELGEQLSIPGVYGLVSSAEATVGRPLTPVSVAVSRGGQHGATKRRSPPKA